MPILEQPERRELILDSRYNQDVNDVFLAMYKYWLLHPEAFLTGGELRSGEDSYLPFSAKVRDWLVHEGLIDQTAERDFSWEAGHNITARLFRPTTEGWRVYREGKVFESGGKRVGLGKPYPSWNRAQAYYERLVQQAPLYKKAEWWPGFRDLFLDELARIPVSDAEKKTLGFAHAKLATWTPRRQRRKPNADDATNPLI